jgi:hypothetical protein
VSTSNFGFRRSLGKQTPYFFIAALHLFEGCFIGVEVFEENVNRIIGCPNEPPSPVRGITIGLIESVDASVKRRLNLRFLFGEAYLGR